MPPFDPIDSGPIYKETLTGHLPIVEPWNTASNLIFLAIVLYWSFRVYKNYRQHRFIAFALPVLFIGYVGGTIYHATRSHNVWLFMDWIPILLLCVAVSVYFAIKQHMSWLSVFLLIFMPFISAAVLRYLGINGIIPRYVESLISYSMMAFTILFPLVRYLVKTQWHHLKWILFAVSSFVIAITCRSIDLNIDFDALPMGTHWLWHSFGAFAANFLLIYIFKDDLRYAGRLTT